MYKKTGFDKWFGARIKKNKSSFIRMGLMAGMIYGLFMTLSSVYWRKGAPFSAWEGVALGIIFGIMFPTCMAMGDYYCTKNLPLKALDIDQNREFQIRGEIEKQFEKCLQSLKNMKNITKLQAFKDNMTILAKAKNSFWGLRWNFCLKLMSIQNNAIKVTITSSLINKGVLFDYGKNYENVEKISKEIISINENED